LEKSNLEETKGEGPVDINEELLQSAIEVRRSILIIDVFFLDPSPEKEEAAIKEVEKLPGALSLYGALCRLADQRRFEAAGRSS